MREQSFRGNTASFLLYWSSFLYTCEENAIFGFYLFQNCSIPFSIWQFRLFTSWLSPLLVSISYYDRRCFFSFFFYRLFPMFQLLEPLLVCVDKYKHHWHLFPSLAVLTSFTALQTVAYWVFACHFFPPLSCSEFNWSLPPVSPIRIEQCLYWYSSECQLRGDLNISRVPYSKLERFYLSFISIERNREKETRRIVNCGRREISYRSWTVQPTRERERERVLIIIVERERTHYRVRRRKLTIYLSFFFRSRARKISIRHTHRENSYRGREWTVAIRLRIFFVNEEDRFRLLLFQSWDGSFRAVLVLVSQSVSC